MWEEGGMILYVLVGVIVLVLALFHCLVLLHSLFLHIYLHTACIPASYHTSSVQAAPRESARHTSTSIHAPAVYSK
jgi:hypothetical protein